jgi:predicted nucleic acid-binding protein
LIYVDTSVLVALLTNESTASIIQQWYAEDDNQVFVTADWTLTEFSSAVSLKQRTGQLTSRQVNTIHKIFDDFLDGGIRLAEVSRIAYRNSAKLIQNMQGLRAGDALHLAVAIELDVKEFATLDKLLIEKVKQVNLIPVQF